MRITPKILRELADDHGNYKQLIYRTVRRYLRCPGDQSDAYQETVLAIARKQGEVLPLSANFESYLCGVARLQALSVVRRNERNREFQLESLDSNCEAYRDDISASLERSELMERVNQEMEGLSRTDREVIKVWLEIGDLGLCARKCGIKKNTFEKRLSRARLALRRRIRSVLFLMTPIQDS